MKTIFRTTLAFLLSLGLNASHADAQGISLPQPSSGQTITQDFGLGKITVTYSRPNTKGRAVFGALEPYGEVWRTGANNATAITLTENITIEGHQVPAGEYALFTIPGKEEWTIILNKTVKQWGAYTYKEADDVLRFKVKPLNQKEKTESFTINFADVYPAKATLQLLWDHTLIPIKLSTDFDSKVMASIEQAMKAEKKPYFQAAQYYFENGKDLKKALEWMNAAEAADPKAPWVRLWKGRVQLKMGDKKGAAASAQAGIQIAKEINNPEYVRLNTGLLEETKK